MFAPLACKNALVDLEGLLPAVLASSSFQSIHYERVCLLYRRLAVGSLLISGDPKDYFGYLFRSARAFVHFAEHALPADRLTSKAHAFLDAVACRDSEGARRIAAAMPRTTDPKREYEEDFIYMRVLMDLYTDAERSEALKPLLLKWRALSKDNPDTRLAVCEALVDRQRESLQTALTAMVDANQRRIAERRKADQLPPEEAATTAHVSVEVLACLELGERLGLTPPAEMPMAPALARAFHRSVPPSADSWQRLG